MIFTYHVKKSVVKDRSDGKGLKYKALIFISLLPALSLEGEGVNLFDVLPSHALPDY